MKTLNQATVKSETLTDGSIVHNVYWNGEEIAIAARINSGHFHTPGPWQAAGESIITEDDKNCIAVIESDGGYEAPCWQRVGNANLIAAAPEMLQAGIELLSCLDNLTTEKFSQGGDRPFREQLRAAIAKVRGETPGQGS